MFFLQRLLLYAVFSCSILLVSSDLKKEKIPAIDLQGIEMFTQVATTHIDSLVSQAQPSLITNLQLPHSEIPSHQTEQYQSDSLKLKISATQIHSLYENLNPLDSISYAEKLHQLIESNTNELSILTGQYSHYLIDRLAVESNTHLSYAEKHEQIGYLENSAEFFVSQNNKANEIHLLMEALAILPLGSPSSIWRSSWYVRLQQLLDSDDINAETNDDWLMRLSDYQRVREQLVIQFNDQPEIFEVAQDDLRNSYFTYDEVALIAVTDNTIDFLNKFNP